jgi:hypothetical protein
MDVTKDSIGRGALAGLVAAVAGGVLLQLAHMSTPDGVRESAMLLVAGAVHSRADAVGWVAYLVYGALIGAGFGWLLSRQKLAEGSDLIWGGLYGAFWWIFSSLVIIPALHGIGPMMPAAIDLIRDASVAWFAANIVWGVLMGGLYAALVARRTREAEQGVVDHRPPRAA